MPNEIDKKIKELSLQLKKEVSEYELESFAGFFTYSIKYPSKDDKQVLNKFQSRLKDFLYLIALNATSELRGNKLMVFNDPNIQRWANILDEIKKLYQKNVLGDLAEFDNSLENKKRIIQYFSFHTYFENGTLSYMEQDLDHLDRVFTPYDDYLINDFGIEIEFLINLYRFSELVSNEKYKRSKAYEKTPEFLAFLKAFKGDNWDECVEKLPNQIFNAFCEFGDCSHKSLKFTREEYCSAFPSKKIDFFLKHFTFQPLPDENYLFFTQSNPLDDKPILQLPSGEYLYTYQKQIPITIGKFLFQHLLSKEKLKDKIRSHREKSLEKKTENIFKNFFNKESHTFFYSNYHSKKNTEQDLLILSRRTAFIIEVKASKFREPFRNPNGFKRLESDFKDSIQYGYEQCLRIEDLFYDDQPFSIFDKNEKLLYEIDPKKYEEVFSIVVTLERLGSIQSDLGLMLNKEENVDYPWSVYIDDLETFLMALRKVKNSPIVAFKEFLRDRHKLHGKAYITDEMDVCGTFLSNPKLFKEIATNKDASATFLPDNQQIFDDLYFTGLGFKDELFIENKKLKKFKDINRTQAWVYKKR